MTIHPQLSEKHVRYFWEKVQKGVGKHDCWIWTGWKNKTQHGRFEVHGKKFLATHVSLFLAGRPRPAAPADYALHGDDCISAACVNPAHLRWGTVKENVDDRDRLHRRTPRCGEENKNAKLTEGKVRLIRASKLTGRQLAPIVGVSQVTIDKIRRGAAWAHVK